MFTHQYWLAELALFKAAFEDPDSSDEVLHGCLKGISFIAQQTLQQCPDREDSVLTEVRACFHIARDRKGPEWLWAICMSIAAHATPPT